MPKKSFDEQFIAALRRAETRSKNVSGFCIIDPQDPVKYGRVMITQTNGGANGFTVEAVGWMPGDHPFRHYGKATGYGYDMHSTVMSGARFQHSNGTTGTIRDRGEAWDTQLRAAGFIVVQVV